jgi:hypothetical protein
MLLTALCVKYDEDFRLPGDLYRLYSAVTDQVLYKRFNTEPERDLARLRSQPSRSRCTPARRAIGARRPPRRCRQTRWTTR